jgi:hypothetical protein
MSTARNDPSTGSQMRFEACSRHSRHCFWGYCRSIDAIGCQSDIAQKIIEKNADYVLTLKGNQGSLREDVELFAAEPVGITRYVFCPTSASRQ